MHDAVIAYVSEVLCYFNTPHQLSVLDLGGRNVNGSVRGMFHASSRYVVVDITPHPSVDVVADAGDLDLGETFEVVISTELLEHTPRGADIVATAYRHLDTDGLFIATMAGPGRDPHGAGGEALPPAGEWYRNVAPDELESWLVGAGFDDYEIDVDGTDVRCWARR